MDEFEKLQHIWSNQPDEKTVQTSAENSIRKINSIQKGYKITRLILALTAMVLFGFYLYIQGYKNTTINFAFAMMGCALFTRIGIEFWCRHKLNAINPGKDVDHYKNEVIVYYKNRNYVHYLVTPATLALYITGFAMLLPFFKESLSPGFYLYIVVSFVILSIVGTVFFIIDIKKEQKMLKELIAF